MEGERRFERRGEKGEEVKGEGKAMEALRSLKNMYLPGRRPLGHLLQRDELVIRVLAHAVPARRGRWGVRRAETVRREGRGEALREGKGR